MKNPIFANDEIYHIYNRGVEKRIIFLDKKDHFRFVHDLFEFNDEAPALNMTYYFNTRTKTMDIRCPYIPKRNEKKPRKLLVKILAWSLMPNHYHLFVQQVQDNGITRFMQKIGIGYAKYFNEKYERSGHLFQGRFRAVHIDNEAHFLHLPFYIHCNPLDLIEPGWRQGRLNNPQKAINFLKTYRWSSHIDYLGEKNFQSVSQRDFLNAVFTEQNETYKAQFENWLENMAVAKNMDKLCKLTLE